MPYIKSFENYKIENLNEEFIGKAIGSLFKSVRNKMALQLSKNIGSAKKVRSLIDQYEKELDSLNKNYYDALKQLMEVYKSSKDEEGDLSKELEDGKKKMERAEKLLEKQKVNLKKKFDLEFNKIIKEEKNPNIKHYINLEKTDMMQRQLEKEMENIKSEVGFDESDVEGSDFLTSILNKKKKEAERTKEIQNKIEQELKKPSKEEKTDTEEATYEEGQEIVYKMDGGQGDENKATVHSDQSGLEEGQIRIETENNPEVIINKNQIV